MLFLNRKAYTISQFVLLWILGILFVILVSLNVLRYRATAQAKEAEAFMQEVRAEQEDRCALGRKYAVYNTHLNAFYKHKNNTRAIRYDLSSGHGISAHHKLLDFRLEMPSYSDGRICCDNCERLNRYYAPCAVLVKRSDFVQADSDCTVYVHGKKGKMGTKKAPASQTQSQPKPVDMVLPVEKSMSVEHPESAAVAVPHMPQEASALPVPAEQPMPPAVSPMQPAVSPEPIVPSFPMPVQNPQSFEPPVVGQVTPEETAAPEPDYSVAKKKTCKIPAQGEFFIDGCNVYQEGARGSVVHTWNFDTCSYETTQTCMMPAKWKRTTDTKEEKGLYPSDLDDYCVQFLKQAPCPAGAASGRECGSVDEVCYKDCQVTDKTEVKESALIILYDVQVKTEQLRCMPAKEITVKVP